MMNWLSRIADKAGPLGSVVAAASCPACFPALASLGAAVGLGFLSEYEGLFLSTLLPLFAGIAQMANAAGSCIGNGCAACSSPRWCSPRCCSSSGSGGQRACSTRAWR